MKFLTIRQPWASLIAVGAKTIETRPFSTEYRGLLAIHAGKAHPIEGLTLGNWSVSATWPPYLCLWGGDHGQLDMVERHTMPLGAVVAVCDLVDVVPMIDAHLGWAFDSDTPDSAVLVDDLGDALTLIAALDDLDVTDQLPFGDFTPGRYAWLLSNVRPIEPVPMKGAQGLRDVPGDVLPKLIAQVTR